MKSTSLLAAEQRNVQLHALARGYVTEGLGKGNFDAIPYIDDVVLRVPVGDSLSPDSLVDREHVRSVRWAAFTEALGAVELLDTYVNEDLSGAAVEYHCTLLDPGSPVRIMDRFRVNLEGEITHQESFFDPWSARRHGRNA